MESHNVLAGDEDVAPPVWILPVWQADPTRRKLDSNRRTPDPLSAVLHFQPACFHILELSDSAWSHLDEKRRLYRAT